MAELLDWDGVWSDDLIKLAMNAVAEIESDEMRRHQMAVSAGIAGAFSRNGAKAFHDALDKVRDESRQARGDGRSTKQKGNDADAMLAIFGQQGLRSRKARKRG